jgi:tetratricopeptide (TPR) repeat protein
MAENPLGLGYDGLAAAYFEAELAERAQATLGEALARNPRHSMAYLLRGDVLYTQGKRDDALKAYRMATQVTALLPWQRAAAQTALGVLYGLQGVWDKAREAFTQAIALDPSYQEAYESLGYLAWKEKKDAEATQWFTKAQDLQPTDEVARYYRHLVQRSATARTTAGASIGPRLLIFPFPLIGGHLRRLGTGEMLAGLVAQALGQAGGITILEGRELEPALQGRIISFPGPADALAALNVGKLLRADLIVYGSHRSYENVLAFDVWTVHVKTTQVLADMHLKTQGKEKLHAAAQTLADKLQLLLSTWTEETKEAR